MEPISVKKPKTRPSPCYLLHFPSELTLTIVAFLDAKSLARASTTCKELYTFFKNQDYEVWRRLCVLVCPSFRTLFKEKQISSKRFFSSRYAWLKAGMSNGLITENPWIVEEGSLAATMTAVTEGTSVRTLSPLKDFVLFPGTSTDRRVFYFEAHIVNAGKLSQLGIGIGDDKTPLDTIPGWNRGGETVGYHGDNGLKYWNMGAGKDYSVQYTTGDVIGCGYDYKSKSVFFTKNGVFLGAAFGPIPSKEYYAMCGSLEPCEVRFRLVPPFVFDIDQFFFNQDTSKKRKN